MKCRHCGESLDLTFVDLGAAPPSNAYLTADALQAPEKWYPLRVLVCTRCWLVQTEDFTGAAELFRPDYAYHSSCSTVWLEHARRYVADMKARLALGSDSMVVEIAANDGYLLQFVQALGIPCLGVEPTAGTASVARRHGLEIVERFFGAELGRELAAAGKQADLLVANNVLAHVPDINDFVQGFAELLKPSGVATFEFPHLVRLVDENQFDTIYHEHFSYLSFHAARRLLEANGLAVFDVQELPTHGGSLRVFAQRADGGARACEAHVASLLERERAAGVLSAAFYAGFQVRAEKVKDEFLGFLLEAKRRKSKVAAYGAAAKGNTLLNFAGVRPDLLPYVCDAAPSKQGRFLPGSRIPIRPPGALREDRPDLIIILPWNIADEIIRQNAWVNEWGGKFVVAVPALRIF